MVWPRLTEIVRQCKDCNGGFGGSRKCSSPHYTTLDQSQQAVAAEQRLEEIKRPLTPKEEKEQRRLEGLPVAPPAKKIKTASSRSLLS